MNTNLCELTSEIEGFCYNQAMHLMHTAANFADNAEDDRVGIEIEFTGLSIKDTLDIVHGFTGGKVIKKENTIKTTLKEVNEYENVYNEAIIPEWVIEGSSIGELIIRLENNQVDDSNLEPEATVLELVTSPLRKTQIFQLQEIVTALRNKGAKGTADGESVSIQYNTEVNEGNIATYNWNNLIDLLRVYMNPRHREQIDEHLNIPVFRKDYIKLYSAGFLSIVLNPNYKPTIRELFDDFFYRQSLELLGYNDAWTMDISMAQKLLLSQKNSVVPLVVKQNKLRISSLLAMAFPQDPITKIYILSGWITPLPIVEWREFNNDFNILEYYREVMGLIYMTKKFGSFDHDTLISKWSGVEESVIRDLRKKSFEQIKNRLVRPYLEVALKSKRTTGRQYSA